MDHAKFENALKIGETAAIEFKRAGGTIETDTFETVCSFSNRFNGPITLRNLEPFPKNPLIASFFRNIGYSEKLGSGARKMFKYGRLYSGVDPEFIEDDVFRIIQPLNENYSFDAENEVGGQKSSVERSVKSSVKRSVKIIEMIKENPEITIPMMAETLRLTTRAVEKNVARLQVKGIVKRVGPDKGGHWEVRDEINAEIAAARSGK